MDNLKVAFVGMERHAKSLPDDYLMTFVRFHLELPYYYAAHSRCDVDVHVEGAPLLQNDFHFMGGGFLRVIGDKSVMDREKYDVVVHWRKWSAAGFHPEAVNVILSQDHTYGPEWLVNVGTAYEKRYLAGILVFPYWHQNQIHSELKRVGLGTVELIPGLTLGVDVDIYRPAMVKDPYHLLWASDPGRGLVDLIPTFLRLHAKDKRFHLTVTYPDYVKSESVKPYWQFLSHPAVKHLPGLRNGNDLWRLFNESGVLPYCSSFMEPSSRCHRQAMAAASLVLYPPGRGTPSDLLENGLNAIVESPLNWPDRIHEMVSSGRWKEIGTNARNLAVSESWQVQAQRFHKYFLNRVAQ